MTSGKRIRPERRDTSSLRRPAPAFESQPRVLIVCEGNRTEPLYFNALRRFRRLSATQIDIVPGGISGSDPRSIVKYARRRKKWMKRQGRRFDTVWCVFDRDEHPKIEQAFHWMEQSHFEVAFSNPCFELWFLLHYRDIDDPLDRFEALRRLRRLMPEYRKTTSVFYLLLPRQNDALRRAEELRHRHRKQERIFASNPSTSVDRLVAYLNALRGRVANRNRAGNALTSKPNELPRGWPDSNDSSGAGAPGPPPLSPVPAKPSSG